MNSVASAEKYGHSAREPRTPLILLLKRTEHPITSSVVTLAQQNFLTVPSKRPSNKSNH